MRNVVKPDECREKLPDRWQKYNSFIIMTSYTFLLREMNFELHSIGVVKIMFSHIANILFIQFESYYKILSDFWMKIVI